jgi:PAS domain S-box-containing protein
MLPPPLRAVAIGTPQALDVVRRLLVLERAEPIELRVVHAPAELRLALRDESADVAIVAEAERAVEAQMLVQSAAACGRPVIAVTPGDGSAMRAAGAAEALTPEQAQAGLLVRLVRLVVAHDRVRRRLQERVESLQFALESAELGDWDMDLRTNATRRSPYHDRAFGYTAMLPEWRYETFLAHIHPEDRDWVDRLYRAALAGGEEYNAEFRVIWPDGSVHWLWSRGRFYHGADGAPSRVAGVVSELTERTRAVVEGAAAFRGRVAEAG